LISITDSHLLLATAKMQYPPAPQSSTEPALAPLCIYSRQCSTHYNSAIASTREITADPLLSKTDRAKYTDAVFRFLFIIASNSIFRA
jgi:hypothetical protein